MVLVEMYAVQSTVVLQCVLNRYHVCGFLLQGCGSPPAIPALFTPDIHSQILLIAF